MLELFAALMVWTAGSTDQESTLSAAEIESLPLVQEVVDEVYKPDVDLSDLDLSEEELLDYSEWTDLTEELRIIRLESEHAGGELTSEQQQIVAEFQELAQMELVRGLASAGSFVKCEPGPCRSPGPDLPSAVKRTVKSFTNAARELIASPARNAVVTRIRADRDIYSVSYATLSEFRRRGSTQVTWLSYQPGQSLGIRAYVFRLETDEEGYSPCLRTVAVWQDPSVHDLNCY